jgi:Uma2 family endonuclease
MQAMTPIKTEAISFEDYLRLYDSYEGGKTEWSDGEVHIYPMTNNPQHQRIAGFLLSMVEYYLDARGMVGAVVPANVPMRIDDKQAPEPDLMVLLGDHRERLHETYVEGIADIVVEVVSPESDERDYGRKRLRYETAGVPEYWLIDPMRERPIIYVLENGLYREREAVDRGKITSLLLPGFTLDAAVLWRLKLPNAREIVQLVDDMLG